MSRIPTLVVCGALSLPGFGADVLSTSGSVASCAAAGLDPSVMSEQYWTIWNDDVQRKIDADIEANRKADAVFEIDAPDGKPVSKFMELK